MRLATSKLWTLSCTGLLALTLACGDEKGEEAEAANEAGTETGDGDGDDEVGDGDGEPGDGDGEPGDGDGEPGDGDGEAGDGDGEPGDGDGEPGDGDGEPGDGDGEPNPECFELDEAECGMNPDCQPVTGSPLRENGPGSPCLEPAEFLGCIGMQGCGDAITWFCGQGNTKWQVNDTCGPEGAEQCDAPMEPVEACM
jgi:hypothetical protein